MRGRQSRDIGMRVEADYLATMHVDKFLDSPQNPWWKPNLKAQACAPFNRAGIVNLLGPLVGARLINLCPSLKNMILAVLEEAVHLFMSLIRIHRIELSAVDLNQNGGHP